MPRFDPIAHRSLKNDTDSIYIHAESCLGLRPVPQFCYNVRNQVLCPFGDQTGKAVRIYPSADLRE